MAVTTAQYRDAQEAIKRRLEQANNPNGQGQLYMAVKAIRPKGFRGSILKAVGWPTSWGVLLDLSPAQISQNREATLAARAWQSTTPTGTDNPSTEYKLLFWRRLLLGYFSAVGRQAIPENDFPRWRKPSWMSEGAADGIKEIISSSYQGDIESALNATDRTDFNALLNDVADAPLASTMPVEDGVSADEEVIAEMSANMDGEEEAVVVEESATTPSPNVRELSRVEGVYNLYRNYFSRVHGVESPLDLRMSLNSRPSSRNDAITNSLLTIMGLEGLGFSIRGIKNFLADTSSRGLAVHSLRTPRNSNYGAYVLVDLKAREDRQPRRYTSGNAYRIMGNAAASPQGLITRIDILKGQFNRENQSNRALQVMRFSGTGSRMVGLQVLSLNFMDGSNTSNQMSYAEAVRKILRSKTNARDAFNSYISNEAPVSRDSTQDTQAQVERAEERVNQSGTQTNPESYRLIGFQFFREGQTFRRQGKFSISLNKFPNDFQTYSYVFYFARENERGSYDLFRSVFGTMQPDSRISEQPNSDMRLSQLKLAWNNSGRLSRPSSIELQEVPVLDKRRLRAAFTQQEEAGLTSSAIEFSVTRSQMRGTPVGFEQIGSTPLAMIASMAQVFRRLGSQEPDNDELVGGSSAENQQQNASIARNVEAIKTKKIDRTFAYEIEGNMMGAPNTRNYQLTLGTAIDKVLNERGLNANRDRYQLNGQGDQRFSTVTVKGDGSVDGPRPFEVDTPVFVPPEIDIAKTNFDEAVSQRKFNDMKWDTYPNMWQWVSVFSEAMLQAGVRIHKSSGLHIHISSSDYNRDDFKRYLENYAGFEPLIDLMMPVNSRKGGRSYNASIIQDGAVTTGYSRGGRTPNPSPSSWRSSGNTGRSKVRTQTGISTIEFRHPMTNIEGDLIKHFIILAYSLVEVSKIKKFTSFKFSDLESFLPDSTATFLYNRIEDLDQPDLPKSKQRAFFGDSPRGRGTQSQLERKNLV